MAQSYMRSVVGRNVMRRIPDVYAPCVRCSTRKWQDDLMLMSRTPFVIVDCHSTTRFCPWGRSLSYAPTNQATHRRVPAPVSREREVVRPVKKTPVHLPARFCQLTHKTSWWNIIGELVYCMIYVCIRLKCGDIYKTEAKNDYHPSKHNLYSLS